MLKQVDPRTPFIFIVQNDTTRALDVALLDHCGDPVDLSSAVSITLNIKNKETNAVSRYPCSILSATEGKVRYLFNSDQTSVIGDYLFNYTVVWPGLTQDTYPKNDYSNLLMRITPAI